MIGAIATLFLLGAAVLGPIVILMFGQKAAKPAMVLLFASGTVAMPLAGISGPADLSEPGDFRGWTVMMTVAIFAFGLVAMSVIGTLRAPARRGKE